MTVSRRGYETALFPGLVTVKASMVGRGRFELPTLRPEMIRGFRV